LPDYPWLNFEKGEPSSIEQIDLQPVSLVVQLVYFVKPRLVTLRSQNGRRAAHSGSLFTWVFLCNCPICYVWPSWLTTIDMVTQR